MLHSIAPYLGGWQVLLPAVVLFCVLGHRLERYVPLSFLAVWLIGVVAMYFLAGIGRFATGSPTRWAAMVAMDGIGIAIPLFAALLGATLFRRARVSARWSGALALGLLGIPVTTLVAGFIGDRVLPYLARIGA